MQRPVTQRYVRGAVIVAILAVVGCSPSSPPDPAGGPVPPTAGTEGGATTGVGVPEEATGAATFGEFTDVSVARVVATDLRTPWGMAFLEDGTALVTLRDSGKVLRIDDGEVTQLDAGGRGGAVPNVHHETEDGLLGIAVGPEQGIFLYLTTSTDNRVVRFDLRGDSLVNPRVILSGIPADAYHNGGRLAFGPDGYLYITTGDTHEPSTSQDTDSLAGKILRVTATGEPARGNPFGNAVWSYGHRNVQGIGWTSDGRMYASEFGENDFDELNVIEPGNNYGWPHVEGWVEDSDYVNPVVTWPTSEASPSGIAVTDSGVWVTALRGKRLWYVPLRDDGSVGEPRSYLDVGRLRDVAITPDGELWVLTSNTDGRGDPGDEDDRILQLELS